jgi:DNA-binding response OmpR family regulator
VPKRILVVEDTANIRRIIAGTLRSRGYEVVESEEGQEAWKRVVEGGVDLVVLDAMLPRKSGIEVCSGMKKDPRFSGIPVLLLTAAPEVPGGGSWKERAGADDFLAKPFKMQDLVSRVERLLASGRRE